MKFQKQTNCNSSIPSHKARHITEQRDKVVRSPTQGIHNQPDLHRILSIDREFCTAHNTQHNLTGMHKLISWKEPYEDLYRFRAWISSCPVRSRLIRPLIRFRYRNFIFFFFWQSRHFVPFTTRRTLLVRMPSSLMDLQYISGMTIISADEKWTWRESCLIQ